MDQTVSPILQIDLSELMKRFQFETTSSALSRQEEKTVVAHGASNRTPSLVQPILLCILIPGMKRHQRNGTVRMLFISASRRYVHFSNAETCIILARLSLLDEHFAVCDTVKLGELNGTKFEPLRFTDVFAYHGSLWRHSMQEVRRMGFHGDTSDYEQYSEQVSECKRSLEVLIWPFEEPAQIESSGLLQWPYLVSKLMIMFNSLDGQVQLPAWPASLIM